jgi:hypothetical protein
MDVGLKNKILHERTLKENIGCVCPSGNQINSPYILSYKNK